MTAGFILEEGLSFKVLGDIVASMAQEARRQNVLLVAGDTKVVPRGKADKIFINTTGLGAVKKRLKVSAIRPQDKILINGPIAQHGLSILLAREKFSYSGQIKSDCNSLWPIVKLLLRENIDVHFMRDPTRGGVSAVTNEVAGASGYSLRLFEKDIPVDAPCKDLSEILGLELLDIANEGKMIFFIAEEDAARALKLIKTSPLGHEASIIGEVLKERRSKVYLKTSIGGEKILSLPIQEPIPRIC